MTHTLLRPDPARCQRSEGTHPDIDVRSVGRAEARQGAAELSNWRSPRTRCRASPGFAFAADPMDWASQEIAGTSEACDSM